jgi:hypothetical protein
MRKSLLLLGLLAVTCLPGCALTLSGLLTEVAFTALTTVISSLVTGAFTPAA